MAEYIDRDEYKEVLMRYLKSHHVWTGTWVSEGMRIAIQGCCELLDNEPAADVEEVKHGRWIEQTLSGEATWCCSECKTIGSPHWKRCPVCEAKMDGGKENEIE